MKDEAIRLVVTGGSGFIGTTAIKTAIEKNYTCVNFDIKPPKDQGHSQYWEYVDILDYEKLSERLQQFQPTHILHLAAKTGMDVYNMSFFAANIEGVRNLIQASCELSQLQRILFTSSLLVCHNGYVPQSDTEFCPPNLYGESKMLGEKIVRSESMDHDWVIVRPTSIWGPWFEHSYRAFFKTVDKGLYFHPGRQPIVKPLGFVGNTVHMMLTLLTYQEEQKIRHKTFYLGDYPECSIQEWANTIQKNMGARPVRELPLSLMRGMAKVGDLCKSAGWTNFPLTSFRLNNMLTGAHYPLESTEKIVGHLPYDLEKGVRETIDWMHAHGEIKHSLVNSF